LLGLKEDALKDKLILDEKLDFVEYLNHFMKFTINKTEKKKS